MNAVERFMAHCTRLLDRLISGNQTRPHSGQRLPVPVTPSSAPIKHEPRMPTGRFHLTQGHAIFSRALPPHAQNVYFIYPPTPEEAAYVAELREVLFVKDATGGFVAQGGRRRKQRERYTTLQEVGQTYNLDSDDWRVVDASSD